MEAMFTDLSISLTDLMVPWIALMLSVVFAFWFKDLAGNISKGIAFKMKAGFEPGDLVRLDGEDAIIINIGIWETVFEIRSEGKTCWRYVPNTRIDFLKLEKVIHTRSRQER